MTATAETPAKPPHLVLIGTRVPAATAEVSLELIERLGPSRFRARPIGHVELRVGDHLRFGDRSNRVCLIGTLNASVASIGVDTIELDFEFHGAALDEMIAAVNE